MSLYVHESGTPGAPTIVFLHAIGTSDWMWLSQVQQLQDFHCLVPHLPGHGQSNAEPWVSLAATADQVAHIIRNRATGGRAHVVGLSLGSYVAAQVLSTAPEVVDTAIMSGLNVLPLPGWGLMNVMGIVMVPFIKTKVMARANAKALRVPAAQYPEYQRNLRLMSRRAFLRASNDAGTFRLPAQLAQVTCPTLVVAGQHEHPLIHQSMGAVVATMPNADARIAPGVGHGWNGEAPELFGRMIRAWVTHTPLPTELLPLDSQSMPAGVVAGR